MYKEITNTKDDPTLEQVQKFVGGYVELVRVEGGVLLIDEEGRLKPNYLPNPKASSLYGDTILGPAIFISNKIKSEWIA